MRKRKWTLIVLISLILIPFCSMPLASSASVPSTTNDWKMFRHTLNHSGETTSNGVTKSAKLLWNYITAGSVWSSPAVANGHVYVGSKDGYIYCFNASNGQLIWKYPTGGEVDSSPAVDTDRLYVGSDDGWFYCMNTTTGMPIWIKWVGWNAGWNSRSSPAIVDSRVYVGSGNHDVFCFNASDGSVIWTYSTVYPVMTSPAISNDTLYIASDDYCVYAINASTGNEIWHTPTGSTMSSPCIFNGCLYIGSYEGYIFCMNASTGSLTWGFQTGDTITSSPAIAYGCVYAGSEDNSIYCINASNGHKIWQTKTGYWVCSSPAIADGNLYVGSEDYNIYCLNASTGAITWSYQTGNYVDSSPAVVNDTLYVGSHDHCIYAFTLCNSTSEASTSKPANSLAWTTIAFDAIACIIGAVIIFGVILLVQPIQQGDRNLQKNNFSAKTVSWLSNHADALFLLGILIFSAAFFVNLGSGFLWLADEQTYSQMAVHMIKTGDYLTPYAFGEPAIWVGKPPLLMWLMSLSYQAFGINNFAPRLWTAIFATLSLVVVFYLGKKFYNRLTGFLSAIVLGTFSTFYAFATHAMTDVPLIFFILASIYFLLLSEERKNTNQYSALSGLCFGLALMTKQTGALLIPIIAASYLAITKRSVRSLITKQFALFLGVAFLVFAPWLIYMTFNFGYDFWNCYFLYSTYSRVVSPIEGHVGSYLYYFDYLATGENLLWVILLPFAAGFSAFSAIKRSKSAILIVTWMAIVLLVFTVSQTKIYYYILPAYPAFALAIGALMYQLLNKTKKLITKQENH